MMNVEVWGSTQPKLTPASQPTGARRQSVDAAVALLSKSRRPVIVAGMGAHRAGAKVALQALADRTGALLMTSARGKDMFHGHPYNLGILGSFSHRQGRRMMDQADCVLVFGAGLNSSHHELRRIRSPGAAHPGRLPCEATSAAGIQPTSPWWAMRGWRPQAMLDARCRPARTPTGPFRRGETLRFLAEFRHRARLRAGEHAPHGGSALRSASALEKLLPAQRNLVYDAGNFLGIVPYLSVPATGPLQADQRVRLHRLGFGTALGVAKARPERPTVLVVGDGGFLMTMGELETVVREDLPLVIVLMNDCAYGAELHFLEMRDLPVAKSVFPDVDFAPIAEAFGFQAATIRTLDDLRRIGAVLASRKARCSSTASSTPTSPRRS